MAFKSNWSCTNSVGSNFQHGFAAFATRDEAERDQLRLLPEARDGVTEDPETIPGSEWDSNSGVSSPEPRLMLRDEYEHLVGKDAIVCEVVRGHAGTGRLHIALAAGALKHLRDQIGYLDIDIDYVTGSAWCNPLLVPSVREVAEALATAR